VALLLAPFFRFFLLDLGSVTRQLFNHKKEVGCIYLKMSPVEALLNCWPTLLSFAFRKRVVKLNAWSLLSLARSGQSSKKSWTATAVKFSIIKSVSKCAFRTVLQSYPRSKSTSAIRPRFDSVQPFLFTEPFRNMTPSCTPFYATSRLTKAVTKCVNLEEGEAEFSALTNLTV
jgi:hypothetical protein